MNVSSCEEAQTFSKTYTVNLCIVGHCISLAAQGRSSCVCGRSMSAIASRAERNA